MDILWDFLGAAGMHNLMGTLSGEAGSRPVSGYHVLLTAPYFCSHSHSANAAYEMQEFERLTAELSARLWRRYNGPVYMMTDEAGCQFIRKSGLENVYDGVFPVLEWRNYGINTYKYWASGKIQALMRIQAPCALVDMDLLVWHPLELDRYALAAAHTEPLRPDIYAPVDFFCVDEDYVFPCGWDWQAKPLNTSIVYFAEESFKEYYAHEAIRFMQSEKETPDDGSICMVFAEQRILAMCAAQRGILPHTFFKYEDLCCGQDLFTHLWSAKRLLRNDRQLADRYCEICRDKILQLNNV